MSGIDTIGPNTPVGPSDIPPSSQLSDGILASNILDTISGSTQIPLQNKNLLPLPNTSSMSINDYMSAISNATLGHKRGLGESNSSDSLFRVAQSLARLNAISEGITISKEVQDLFNSYDDLINGNGGINEQIARQNERIRNINRQNAADGDQTDALNKAADNANKAAQAIIDAKNNGATDKELEPLIAAYQAAVENYNKAATDYNNYVTQRNNQINDYNSETDNYNNAVKQNNKIIKSNNEKLIDIPGMETVPSQEEGKNISLLPKAEIIDPSGDIQFLNLLENPNRSDLPEISSIDFHLNLIDFAGPIIQSSLKILAANNSFVNALNKSDDSSEEASEALTLPLSKRILPPSIIEKQNQSTPLGTNAGTGSTMSLIQATAGIDPAELQKLLTLALASQTYTDTSLRISSQEQEKLRLLTGDLLGETALRSLLPALNPFSSSLDQMDKNNPAIPVSYAISFANRTQELVNTDIIAKAVEKIIDPQKISALPATEKQELINKISGAISSFALLTSASLLSKVLGLPGLIAQVLGSILPENVSKSFAKSGEQKTQEKTNTANDLQNYFAAQGFSPEEVNTLSKTAEQLLAIGSIASPAAKIAQNTIDYNLLQNSTLSSVILNGYSQKNSENAVKTALSNALGPKEQTEIAFRESLKNQLSLEGIDIKAAQKAASEAVILNQNTNILQNTIPGYLSSNEIASALKNRVEEILTPSAGKKLSETLAKEAVNSITGNANNEGTELATPTSFISSLKEQVQNLNKKENNKYTEELADAFQNFIRPSQDLNTLSMRIMDPANIFVTSMFEGVMYAGRTPENWKKFLSINV